MALSSCGIAPRGIYTRVTFAGTLFRVSSVSGGVSDPGPRRGGEASAALRKFKGGPWRAAGPRGWREPDRPPKTLRGADRGRGKAGRGAAPPGIAWADASARGQEMRATGQAAGRRPLLGTAGAASKHRNPEQPLGAATQPRASSPRAGAPSPRAALRRRCPTCVLRPSPRPGPPRFPAAPGPVRFLLSRRRLQDPALPPAGRGPATLSFEDLILEARGGNRAAAPRPRGRPAQRPPPGRCPGRLVTGGNEPPLRKSTRWVPVNWQHKRPEV